MLIPEWVTHYLSIPYEELDCWGLCKLIYFERYEMDIGDINEQRDKIKSEEWEDVYDSRVGFLEGDILLFKSSPINRHVALILTADYMIHSVKPIGVVIEKWTHRNWKSQLKAVYRNRKR